MGYCSDVALTLLKKDALDFIKEAQRQGGEILNFVRMAELMEHNDGTAITFFWEYVKWYSRFPEVAFINDYYPRLVNYSFKRIGEERTDIEQYDGENADCEDLSLYYEVRVCFDDSYVPSKVIHWLPAQESFEGVKCDDRVVIYG